MRVSQTKEIKVKGLGDRIKQARLASAKTLGQICLDVGISKTYWYEIESESIKGTLSIENLRKIEDALDIDLDVSIE